MRLCPEKCWFLFVWLFFYPMICPLETTPPPPTCVIHQTACPGFHRTTSWLKTTSWFRMFSFKRSRDAGIFEVVNCKMVEDHRRDGWHGTVAYNLRVSFINRRDVFDLATLCYLMLLCIPWSYVCVYILSIGYLLWCFVFLFSLLVKFLGNMFILFFDRALIDWLID